MAKINTLSGCTIGTSHFPSHGAALRYYTGQDPATTAFEIVRMVNDKTISIGRPKAKSGETVFLNTEEERYFIKID